MKKRNIVVLLVLVGVLVFPLSRFIGFLQSRGNNQKRPIPYTKLDYIEKGEAENKGNTTGYRFPGEFEKQQAIWMQWPSAIYSQGEHPVAPAVIEIIKSIAEHERLNLAVATTDEITQIKELLKNVGYKDNNIHFYEVEHSSIWARDVGPIFVKDTSNNLHVVDFGFNNYSRGGDEHYISVESQVDRKIAEIYGFPVMDTKLISEGGAIESNGKGTLMLTESVILKRNPNMSKAQIEEEYKRVLGVTNFVWLKKGLAEDDRITSGHINEIARFANPNTVLLAQILPDDRYVDDSSNESYLRMEENYEILKKAVDQNGKHFKIIRIPMPPTIYQKPISNGKIPIRSYLNYAVINGAIIAQTYWKPGMSGTLKAAEDGVISILEEVYPGRKVIGIDALNVNLWGGGIHCITQHMPE